MHQLSVSEHQTVSVGGATTLTVSGDRQSLRRQTDTNTDLK